ncbi:MAG: hypothetical protein ACJ72G_02140 [Friedmanniella sp.]
MLNHWMGRAAMIVALPALLAGSLAAPAYAYGGGGGGGGHGGGDDDGDGRGGGRDRTVHVTVCKEVRGGDRWDDRGRGRDRDRDRDRDFNIRLRTTEDRDTVELRRGECDDVYLDYDRDDKTVYVREFDIPRGYRFDELRCWDGHDYERSRYSCDFDDNWVKITVVNRRYRDRDRDRDR